MKSVSLSSLRLRPSWRHAQRILIGLVMACALGAVAIGYEMYRGEEILVRASTALGLGDARTAHQELDALSTRPSFRAFVRLGLLHDDQLLRLRCVALTIDRELEKAVDVCTEAIASAHDPAVKNEVQFNRAVTYVPLAIAGVTPKGLSRAMEDLVAVLRTDEHARAAVLLEKLNLLKSAQGKAGDSSPGDSGRRSPSQMFDETPSTGGAGQIEGI